MPYTNNNGVKIYYEVEGQGPPLVLAHALAGSSNSWRRDGYIDSLRNDYRLIFFDARGHGKSDKPYDASACYVTIMASDVTAIIDNLGIEQAHYFGYSLGARVGFWLAAHNGNRFFSFILGGNTPYDRPEIMEKIMRGMVEGWKLKIANPEAYEKRLVSQVGHPLTDQERKNFLSVDTSGLIPVAESFLSWPSFTDQDLERISYPCLVFCGELDESGSYPGAKESANHIPNAKFVSFPGLGHFQAGAKSDLVVPKVKEFLAQVSKK